jgi:hypothetical protein
MDLQLIGGLGWRVHYIDLQTWMAALVELHADDEQYAVGHFDSKLPAIGAERGTGDRVTAESREALGDPTQFMKRHRSERRACHSSAPRSRISVTSSRG